MTNRFPSESGDSGESDAVPRDCSAEEWKIFSAYYERLVRSAEKLLSRRRQRVSDGDDIASMTLRSFFRRRNTPDTAAAQGKEDEWKQLTTIARRKVYSQIRRELRQKRGGGNVRGFSVFADLGHGKELGFAQLAGHSPTPEEATIALDTLNALLADLSPEESNVMAARLEGYTTQETAERLGCSVSSVERRLRLIRLKLSQLKDSESTEE